MSARPTKPKRITIDEFRKKYQHSGASVMALAYYATEEVTGDDEFFKAAQAAVNAEDEFDLLLNKHGIVR